MKCFSVVLGAAVLLVAGFAASPASAQVVMHESSCTDVVGSNSLTHDCGFNVKNYVVGSPVTFTVNYACTGSCGPVLSFGLRDAGFTPEGVSGHLVGGRRVAGGLELTFVFDALKKTGGGAVGNAHFSMNLMVDDGQGTRQVLPCGVDVHLKAK
jgi:hypothetical protein